MPSKQLPALGSDILLQANGKFTGYKFIIYIYIYIYMIHMWRLRCSFMQKHWMTWCDITCFKIGSVKTLYFIPTHSCLSIQFIVYLKLSCGNRQCFHISFLLWVNNKKATVPQWYLRSTNIWYFTEYRTQIVSQTLLHIAHTNNGWLAIPYHVAA